MLRPQRKKFSSIKQYILDLLSINNIRFCSSLDTETVFPSRLSEDGMCLARVDLRVDSEWKMKIPFLFRAKYL